MRIRRKAGRADIETGRYSAYLENHVLATRKVAVRGELPVIELNFVLDDNPDNGQYAGAEIQHLVWLGVNDAGEYDISGKGAGYLDSLMNRKLSVGEEYDMDQLVGRYCFVQIMLKREGDKKYSNIVAIEPYDGQEPLDAVYEEPEPQSPPPPPPPPRQPAPTPTPPRAPAPASGGVKPRQSPAPAAPPVSGGVKPRQSPAPAPRPSAPAPAPQAGSNDDDMWSFPETGQ